MTGWHYLFIPASFTTNKHQQFTLNNRASLHILRVHYAFVNPGLDMDLIWGSRSCCNALKFLYLSQLHDTFTRPFYKLNFWFKTDVLSNSFSTLILKRYLANRFHCGKYHFNRILIRRGMERFGHGVKLASDTLNTGCT